MRLPRPSPLSRVARSGLENVGLRPWVRRLGLLAASVALASCSRIETSETSEIEPTTSSSVTETTNTTDTATSATEASTTIVATAEPTTTETSVDPPVDSPPAAAGLAALVPEVVNTFPHDPLAFTQGLEFHRGMLIEGVGEYGRSERRIVDVTTGAVTVEAALPLEQFGNGLTVSDERLIQITWRDGRAIIADPNTLEATGQFAYDGEGWGICSDTERLIMSNGTSSLTFRDPASFEPTGSVEVTLGGQPLLKLNELECVDGTVWANIWLSTDIVQIDPSTGEVLAVVDARSLVPSDQALGREDVLNGIAYNRDSATFFVTGKRWNTLYEVRFVPAN